MLRPLVRHVTTCLSCGFREATPPGRGYAERCPNDGQPLEHYDGVLSREELRTVASDGMSSRRRTHSFTTR